MIPITYDFGEVESGENVSHTFMFEDTIISTKPDCNCTTSLPKGNSVKINYTVPELLPGQDRTIFKGVTVKTLNSLFKAIIKLTVV